MIKKCLHLSFTTLTLMVVLLCVRLSIAVADAPSNKSESIAVPIPKDSVLHLIPEQTLGLIYCPNLLDLDNRINTLKRDFFSETQASDVSVEILSSIFGSQFEGLFPLEEEIFDASRDLAIVPTRLEPLQFAVLAHLRDPETIKQIIEKVTSENERMEYKDVTYWNDSEDGEVIAILNDILIFSKQREVCENIIDTYRKAGQALTKNPDYASFLSDISEDKDQLAVYFDIETAIAMFDRSLEEELEMVIDTLEDADEDDDFDLLFLKGISEFGVPFIKQVRSASIRLQIEGNDVQIKPFLKFSSDSEFLDVLKEGTNELAFLSELPHRAFVNAAFQGSPKFLTETSKLWFGFFPKKTREERVQRDNVIEQTKDFYESLADRWSFSVDVAHPESPVFIYELKDEQRAKTYMDEVFPEKLSWTETYPGQAILHNRVAIQSYVFPNFKLAQEPSDLVPPRWHWYYAFTEGHLLFTTGTSPEAMQIVLDRRAGSKERFADHPSYQKLIPKLGTDNNVLLAVSPIIAAKTLPPLEDQDIGLNFNIDPNIAPVLKLFSSLFMTLPDNYSLGLSAKAKGDGIDANLLLNLDDFKQLAQMVAMVGQMVEMQ